MGVTEESAHAQDGGTVADDVVGEAASRSGLPAGSPSPAIMATSGDRRTVRGTQGWLRSMNDRRALGLLFEHGPLTRSQLWERSGLSRPTAAQMLTRLEAAGLVGPVGTTSTGRGPSATVYGVRADLIHGVAIDVSHTALIATLADATGADYPIVTIPRTNTTQYDAEVDVRDAISAACEKSGVATDAVTFTCVGLQGSFDADGDRLTFAEHLPGWRKFRIKARLEESTGTTVLIENDVNLAVIAERDAGAAQDVDSLGLVWLGHGIGAGFMLGGRLHRGAAGTAGEIGMLSPDNQVLGGIPPSTTLEAISGGGALLALAQGLGHDIADIDAAIGLLATGPEDLLGAYAPRVAAAILPSVAVVDPQLVILGGPSGRAGGRRLAELVGEHLRNTTERAVRIEPTVIDSHPVLRGARALLRERIRQELLERVELGA